MSPRSHQCAAGQNNCCSCCDYDLRFHFVTPLIRFFLLYRTSNRSEALFCFLGSGTWLKWPASPAHALTEFFAFLRRHLLPALLHPASPVHATARAAAESTEQDLA